MRISGFDTLDFLAGVLVVAFGIALALLSLDYSLGELRRMGPGYFPLVTGVIIALLGVGVIADSRRSRTEALSLRLRPMIAVLGSILWFALTIERLGLAPSVGGMVLLASLAQQRPSAKTIALTAGFLVLFSIGVFVYGLNLPLAPLRY